MGDTTGMGKACEAMAKSYNRLVNLSDYYNAFVKQREATCFVFIIRV